MNKYYDIEKLMKQLYFTVDMLWELKIPLSSTSFHFRKPFDQTCTHISFNFQESDEDDKLTITIGRDKTGL